MPNINFPSSPIAGDTYSFNGVFYIFDGFIWIAQSGLIGPTGPAGSIGPTGATGQGFNYTGDYVSIQNYFPYDVVSYQGSSYVSLVTSTPPHEPDIYPAYWSTLSEKGDSGIQGEIGPTGSQGPVGATGPQGYASLVFGGVISGATAWSSSNDGTVTLPNVVVGLYDNSEFLGDVSTYSVIGGKTGTGSIPALSNNDTNFIFIKYNGGNPVYDIDQSGDTINDSDIVRYMTVYRLNNFVHNLEFGNQGAGLPNKINNRILSVDRFARESGLTIGLSGSSGIVTLSSGVAWNGTFRQNIAAVNSADDIFFKNYHVGGVWTYSTTSDHLNNTYYDDGDDIVVANSGKYLINWYFRGQEINDHLYEVYGNAEYDNVASAQISTEPSLPELITSHAFLVGRVIVQVGTYSGLAETSFTTTFQATAVTAHNDLSSKQGGQANEYYHLDANQYNNLVVADGLQTVGQTLEWDGIYWKSVSIVGATGSQGDAGPTGSPGVFNGDIATFSQIKATFSYFGTSEVNPTSWVDIEGSNSSYSSLRIRQGIEPSIPNDGDIYYDGTHSYFRIGSIWSQLDNEPNDPNTITVAKEGGQFLTIKEAVDSITTASASNTFVVKVRAGVYLEDTITMKSYVAIVGESSISTIIQANDPNQTLINLVDQSAVFDCQIQGCTGTGVAAVVYSSTTTPQTNAIAYVENVRFGTNYTHAKVIGTASGNCIMQCSNVKYGGYPFTIGFQATNDGTGVGRMQLRNVTSTNGGITTTSGLIFAKADAQGCGFIVNGCLLTKSVGAAAGIGFQVENGGFLRLTGVNFQRWSKAIYAPVDSGAPSIDAIALNFENNTIDVQIDNTSATGKIQGVDNYSKTIISPTASLYVVNKDQKRIIVAKKGGDFSSIKSAVESITDSSDTNRYVVEVGPGVFYEGMIDLSNKPYVSIVGSNIQTTQIFASFSNHHLFKMGLANEISFLSLSEVGSGYAAIFADDSGDFSQAHKLSFYNCDIGISVRSATQETLFYGEYVDFNGTYTSAVVVDSNGSNFRCFANIENFYTFPSSGGSVAASVKDTFGELKVSVASLTGAGLDTAFYLENGASLNVTSTEITGYEYGLDNPDIGTFSTFVFNGVNIDESVVFPLRVKQPLTDGLFSGTIHDHTTIENDSPNVYWTFLDQIDGELNVTRKLSVTFVDNTTTDLTTLVFETAPMGVLDGGEISIDSGLVVTISAGYGYLQVINSPTHKRIDWPVSQISLPANSSNYIYINENENLVYNASLPDISQNILLGRVVTTNSSILLIDNTRVDSEHATNKLNLFNRRALGAIYESGSIVTTAGSQSMNITPGSYWFGESNFTPTGGLTVSFSQFIRDGLGDWIISMTNSVTNQFDNNSGSLITMSASYFTKHTLYVVGELVDEQYLLVVGQTQYLNLVDAESAGLSNPPSYFEDGVVPISAIYVQEGNSSIYQIEDIRPVLGFKSSGVNASSDHGNLLGLSDDDHPQYLLSDGSRSMTGNLQMGSNSIAGVSQVNGVTVESHHTRHLPGGADALTVGIPSSIGTVSSEGVLNSFVRQDHIHAHGDLPGGTLHDVATSISSGFLSSTDKQFIDSIPTDYLKNIGGTVSGKLHVSGTVSSPSITITGTASINNLSISGRLIDQSGSSGNNGEILKSTATGSLWYPNKGSFGITVDGSGQDITIGEKGFVVLPYDGEITGWDIISSATCSCVVDLWKSTSIPTVANTITGSEKPTLTNQQKNNDYSLSTWTTLFSEGDIISFNVDSATNCQRVTIIIKINKK